MRGPHTIERWKEAAPTSCCDSMPQPIYLSADIRRIEQAAGDAAPSLMERAGAAAADLAAQLLSDRAKDVLVLAGPGNNGGDARVVARLLTERFFRVTLANRVDEVAAIEAVEALGKKRPSAERGERLRTIDTEPLAGAGGRDQRPDIPA